MDNFFAQWVYTPYVAHTIQRVALRAGALMTIGATALMAVPAGAEEINEVITVTAVKTLVTTQLVFIWDIFVELWPIVMGATIALGMGFWLYGKVRSALSH